MGPEWIGRKLRVASPALAARFAWEMDRRGRKHAAFPPITACLLDELGRWLQAGEGDPTLPLQRTTGLLRLPGEGPSGATVPEIAHLDSLVRAHVEQLPGADAELDQRVHAVMRATARSTVRIHAGLLAGRRDAAKGRFGGLAVLSLAAEVFPHAGETLPTGAAASTPDPLKPYSL